MNNSSYNDPTNFVQQRYKGLCLARNKLKGIPNCPEEVKRFTECLGELFYFSEGNITLYQEHAAFWNSVQEKMDSVA